MEGWLVTVEQPPPRMLSPADAFFVAYQEGSGILMQMGFELELKGILERAELESMLLHLVTRWPQLGQRLQQRLFGLAWDGPCRTEEMLRVGGDTAALRQWHNQLMDPFREPPFQVFWIYGDARHILAARAHHSVVDGEALLQIHLEMMKVLAELKGGQSCLRPSWSHPQNPLAGLNRLARSALLKRGAICAGCRRRRRPAAPSVWRYGTAHRAPRRSVIACSHGRKGKSWWNKLAFMALNPCGSAPPPGCAPFMPGTGSPIRPPIQLFRWNSP